ncbi:MAG TPA: ester cyclase [Thermodesulfobacteriota bacterium]
MSTAENVALARKFVQEMFNERKIDKAENFVTSDIVYHGLEEIKGIENFKRWVGEDLKAFHDMNVAIEEAFGEENKVALKWTLSAMFDTEFLDLQFSKDDETKGVEIIQVVREKFVTQGVEILHFDGGKIKEAWTVFDVMTPARKIATNLNKINQWLVRS